MLFQVYITTLVPESCSIWVLTPPLLFRKWDLSKQPIFPVHVKLFECSPFIFRYFRTFLCVVVTDRFATPSLD